MAPPAPEALLCVNLYLPASRKTHSDAHKPNAPHLKYFIHHITESTTAVVVGHFTRCIEKSTQPGCTDAILCG